MGRLDDHIEDNGWPYLHWETNIYPNGVKGRALFIGLQPLPIGIWLLRDMRRNWIFRLNTSYSGSLVLTIRNRNL